MPYFDPVAAESEEQHYLEVAAAAVQELAPAPDPLPAPDTYSTRAARAERLLLGWLRTTKGGIPGATGSKTFSSLPVVQNLVRSAMGPYYMGTAAANTGYVETWR